MINSKELIDDEEYLLHAARITPNPRECLNFFYEYVNEYLKKSPKFRMNFLKALFLNIHILTRRDILVFVDAYDFNEEYETLKEFGIEKQAIEECANPETVQKMLKGEFKKENLLTYCKLKLDSIDGVNVMIEKGLNVEEIEEYLSYSYMRLENLDRYIQYESDSIQDKILKVNMDLDYKPYEITKIVEKFDDYTLLVNKYNALPEGYHPDDLEILEHVCVLGQDYSCPDMTIMIRKDVGKAWKEFCKEASEQGIELRAIAGLRTYDYQKSKA